MLLQISRKSWFPYLLLFVIVVAGYWQISMMKHPLKYDMIDCYYPWRYMIAESLRNGFLPFWNPFQVLGYPIHADPQSGAWYPVTWIVSILYGYDIFSLHIEYILHLCIAAFGMFFLCKTLKFDISVCFFVAVAYVFSGFFIGNSQHFTFTISGAWIPLILSQFILLFEKQHLKNALYFSFFMFMLISGGYPAFLFILFYFLVSLFCFFIIKLIKEKKLKQLKRFILLNFTAIISTLLFSMVLLVSVYYLIPHVTRGGNVSPEMAGFCPFSPRSMISFLLPFAVIRNMSYYDTDLSMSNAYFGIFMLIFFFYALLKKSPGIYRLFLVFGLLSLLASMGNYLPVREFLYKYVPLMGMFRFPSLFRFFIIFFFLLMAGYGLNTFLSKENFRDKKLIGMIIITSGFLLWMLIQSRLEGYLMIKGFIKNELFKASEISFIRQHIAFQSVVQMAFLVFFTIGIVFIKNRKKLVLFIAFLFVSDAIFSSQLNAPYTVYYKNFNAGMVKKISKGFPEGFHIKNDRLVSQNCDTCGLNEGPFWKNLCTFHKHIAYDGFAPIAFKGYTYLVDSLPENFNKLINNFPVFLASGFCSEYSAKHNKNISSVAVSKICYLPQNEYNQLNKVSPLTYSNVDTVWISAFSPYEIKIQSITKSPRLLCLLQNYYPGWELQVNEKKSDIIKVNFGMLGAQVPEGKNTILFRYNFKPVKAGLYISAVSLFMFFLYFIIGFLKKAGTRKG
ncbi:MAG: YfhO family protein [Bacteroidales bacterium]|jgi:hypothetical protein|nr:YfhO family protein [Bacteroidales bacterium]